MSRPLVMHQGNNPIWENQDATVGLFSLGFNFDHTCYKNIHGFDDSQLIVKQLLHFVLPKACTVQNKKLLKIQYLIPVDLPINPAG